METLFTNERDPSDDYYAILGCDELSNVGVNLHCLCVVSLSDCFLLEGSDSNGISNSSTSISSG